MELPITVMITLFVAVVVAMIIVSFSYDTILEGKKNINRLGSNQEDKFDEKVINLENVDGNVVKDLATQCTKDVQHSTQETLCFVVRSSSFNVASIKGIDGAFVTGAESNFTIKVNVASSFNAIFIHYNPLGFIEVKN